MPNEKRPPGEDNAGTGSSEFHQLDCTAPRRRVKRSNLCLSDENREMVIALWAKLDQRIDEGDEHKASCLARHAARIHKNHRQPEDQK